MKVSKEGKLYEAEDEEISGINIDKAKLILRAEDKFDKIFEREKIKNRKREEKRKLNEAKKRKNAAQVIWLAILYKKSTVIPRPTIFDLG